MRTTSVACICLLCLWFQGCGSVQDHRARQFSSHFSTLSASTQNRLLGAQIHIGDSSTSVYIALGTPQYTIDNSDESWQWIYWGVEADDAPGNEEIPIFFSRAELRIPKPGEKRQALRLWFSDDKLSQWKLEPINLSEARKQKPIPLGTLPREGVEKTARQDVAE